jgi:hypothetical protein
MKRISRNRSQGIYWHVLILSQMLAALVVLSSGLLTPWEVIEKRLDAAPCGFCDCPLQS